MTHLLTSPVLEAYIASLRHHLSRRGMTIQVSQTDWGLLLRGDHYAISLTPMGSAINAIVQAACGPEPMLGRLTDCPVGLPAMLTGKPITTARVELSDPGDVALATHAAHAAAIQIETTAQWSGRAPPVRGTGFDINKQRIIRDVAYQSLIAFHESSEHPGILVSHHMTGTQIIRVDDHAHCGTMVKMVCRGSVRHGDALAASIRLSARYYERCPIAICSWDALDDGVEISLAIPIGDIVDPGFGAFAVNAMAGAVAVYENDPHTKALLSMADDIGMGITAAN